MTISLRVYFHFRSPYSRLGLQSLHQAEVVSRLPLSLHILTKAAGTDEPINPTSTPARARYLMEDVTRMTTRAGVSLKMPRPMDPDYRPSYAAFYAAHQRGAGLPFAVALSNLRWGEGADISDPAVLTAAFVAAGLDNDTQPVADFRPFLAADTDGLEADGAFGVPFAVLETGGRPERFWGHDRFDILLERIEALTTA